MQGPLPNQLTPVSKRRWTTHGLAPMFLVPLWMLPWPAFGSLLARVAKSWIVLFIPFVKINLNTTRGWTRFSRTSVPTVLIRIALSLRKNLTTGSRRYWMRWLHFRQLSQHWRPSSTPFFKLPHRFSVGLYCFSHAIGIGDGDHG